MGSASLTVCKALVSMGGTKQMDSLAALWKVKNLPFFSRALQQETRCFKYPDTIQANGTNLLKSEVNIKKRTV